MCIHTAWVNPQEWKCSTMGYKLPFKNLWNINTQASCWPALMVPPPLKLLIHILLNLSIICFISNFKALAVVCINEDVGHVFQIRCYGETGQYSPSQWMGWDQILFIRIFSNVKDLALTNWPGRKDSCHSVINLETWVFFFFFFLASPGRGFKTSLEHMGNWKHWNSG